MPKRIDVRTSRRGFRDLWLIHTLLVAVTLILFLLLNSNNLFWYTVVPVSKLLEYANAEYLKLNCNQSDIYCNFSKFNGDEGSSSKAKQFSIFLELIVIVVRW